ncbi:MAG: DNA methylase, partial [Spirochaetes bacterium]|nr:DNA methylase [Spirochaetota bacterium]
LEVLIFEKRINGAIFYLTETRTGKKELSLNTMYIRRGRDNALADPAPSSETLPLEDDNDHFRKLCQELISKSVSKEYRYYGAPDQADLQRETKVLALLQARFSEWQKRGFIPMRKIEPGMKTDEPIRNRAWTYWHHLFNPRQLLTNGLFAATVTEQGDRFPIESRIVNMIGVSACAEYNSKLSRIHNAATNEGIVESALDNKALNPVWNHGARPTTKLGNVFGYDVRKIDPRKFANQTYQSIQTSEASVIKAGVDLWLTDPPYADAVSYHEISEFYLFWYEKPLRDFFPDWVTESRRDLAIKGAEVDFRRAMIAAYSNLCRQTSDAGLQVVMFTHQDAGVWADLAVILWASGMHVTAAWTIATETTSAQKEGNFVQGTVLLFLRKNTSTDVAFLDEMVPRIEQEVKAQVESMEQIEDKEEPNFSDTDYQLAAYAAALRIITGYRQIEDLNVERELSRSAKDAKSPLESIIENARNVAAAIRIPEAFDILLWKSISPEERYYLRGLDFESKGENKAGAFQELAKNYGIRDYTELLGSVKANETRVKTAAEFASAQMSGDGFAASTLRHLLYAIHVAVTDENPETGRNYLRSELPDFWSRRQNIIKLLEYLARFEHSVRHRSAEFKMAALLAGVLANDAG